MDTEAESEKSQQAAKPHHKGDDRGAKGSSLLHMVTQLGPFLSRKRPTRSMCRMRRTVLTTRSSLPEAVSCQAQYRLQK